MSKLYEGTKTDFSAKNEHIEETFKMLDVLTKSGSVESEEKEKDVKKSILNPEMMGLNTPEHNLEQLKEFGMSFGELHVNQKNYLLIERISSYNSNDRTVETRRHADFLKKRCKSFAEYLALAELLGYIKNKTYSELESDLKPLYFALKLCKMYFSNKLCIRMSFQKNGPINLIVQ